MRPIITVERNILTSDQHCYNCGVPLFAGHDAVMVRLPHNQTYLFCRECGEDFTGLEYNQPHTVQPGEPCVL